MVIEIRESANEIEIVQPYLEPIYTGEYIDGVRAEDREHSHVDVVLHSKDRHDKGKFLNFFIRGIRAFTYQYTEVDVCAKEWAEDDGNHDVRPVVRDVVNHEER